MLIVPTIVPSSLNIISPPPASKVISAEASIFKSCADCFASMYAIAVESSTRKSSLLLPPAVLSNLI